MLQFKRSIFVTVGDLALISVHLHGSAKCHKALFPLLSCDSDRLSISYSICCVILHNRELVN